MGDELLDAACREGEDRLRRLERSDVGGDVRRERGGPGVGLALVKALVELHGGWAEVESEPGKGAAFILHLPLGAATTAAPPELQLDRPQAVEAAD